MEKKRLFIAIAVQAPDAMTPLPGVHEAAEKMAEFARISDSYDDPLIITDAAQSVTSERLQNALIPAVLLGRPRINVYFCGHGAFMDGTEVWYLSEGQHSWRERVDVMALRDVLATYAPAQISIFSDACQTPETHATKASAILDEQRGSHTPPDIDIFRATIRGSEAFATQDEGPLFSKVMTEALCAQPPDTALDIPLKQGFGRDVVSSQSLKIYVKNNLPDYAAMNGVHQHPEMMPGTVFDTNDYLEVFAPTSFTAGHGAGDGDEIESLGFEDGIERNLPGGQPATIQTYQDLDQRTRSPQALESALNDSISEWRTPFWNDATGTADVFEADTRFIVQVDGFTRDAPYDIRLHLANTVDDLLPSKIVAPFAHFSKDVLLEGPTPAQTGILQVDDVYIPLALGISWNLSLIANVRIIDPSDSDISGAHVIGWHETGLGDIDRPAISPMQALKGLLNGYLGADAIAPIADELRQYKHFDPLFGIVSAYLYDRAGDIDAIRRLGYFYARYGQAIPIDIALLARLPLRSSPYGGFEVDIPETPEDISARESGLSSYVWQATEAQPEAIVSGVTPILRAGWVRMQRLVPEGSPLKAFTKFDDHLTSAPFSSVRGHEAGRALINLVRRAYQNQNEGN